MQMIGASPNFARFMACVCGKTAWSLQRLFADALHALLARQANYMGVARGPLQERSLQFQHRNVRVKKLGTHVQLLINF